MAFWDPLLDRIVGSWAHRRGFVLGPGVVDRFDRWFGRDQSEFAPSEYGSYLATSNAVYVCSTIRADLLSSSKLQLKIMQLDRNGDKAEVTEGDLISLLQKVNPFWTQKRLLRMSELSLSLWGQVYWFLERGESGTQTPREIWWARPDRVKPVPHPEKYISGFLYDPINSGDTIPFSPQEVIWIRYPNPLDEFSGLSPIAAARIAADSASASMHSNRNLFAQGLQLGGFIMPPKDSGMTWTPDQAGEFEKDLQRRFAGVDRAHRWAVLRQEYQIKDMGMTMKDAEFINLLNWSLEDVARAYKIPLDLIGGQRTYENFSAAMKAVWTHAILPEADFLAEEITEQLLPMFPGVKNAFAEFDSSDVEVLREAETAAWERESGQIEKGAITVNEWREDKGMDPVPWGSVWWAPLLVSPVSSSGSSTGTPESENDVEEPTEQSWKVLGAGGRTIIYGSPEHELWWGRFERRSARWEKRFAKLVEDLFERQKSSVLAKLRRSLKSKKKRDPISAQDDPFDMAKWIKAFQVDGRPLILSIIAENGQEALDDAGILLSFSVDHPEVVRFLEQRAQRFAVEVNTTTWNLLQDSLGQGITDGLTAPELEQIVEDVMAGRIRSTAETIARTEVNGAANGGALLAYKQSDVVDLKTWISALLPGRTRECHAEAHFRYQDNPIPLEENFSVCDGAGPAPGQIGTPLGDVNCLCTIAPVVLERKGHAIISPNGKHKAEEKEVSQILGEMDKLLVKVGGR